MKNVRIDELKMAFKEDVVLKFLPSIESSAEGSPLNFLEISKSDVNTDMYDAENSAEIYRNFLSGYLQHLKKMNGVSENLAWSVF